MFGLNTTTIDLIALLIALIVILYVSITKKLFEKGADEYQALWLCRIPLAHLVWSFGFGLLAFMNNKKH